MPFDSWKLLEFMATIHRPHNAALEEVQQKHRGCLELLKGEHLCTKCRKLLETCVITIDMKDNFLRKYSIAMYGIGLVLD